MKILIKFLSRKLHVVARRRVGQYKAGEEIKIEIEIEIENKEWAWDVE